jgi:hypothetical protein
MPTIWYTSNDTSNPCLDPDVSRFGNSRIYYSPRTMGCRRNFKHQSLDARPHASPGTSRSLHLISSTRTASVVGPRDPGQSYQVSGRLGSFAKPAQLRAPNGCSTCHDAWMYLLPSISQIVLIPKYFLEKSSRPKVAKPWPQSTML